MVGPAACGRVGTERYPVRFPPRAECGFPTKNSEKDRSLVAFRHRFAIVLASCWHRVGIVLASFWHRFGIVLALFWYHFGIILASIWDPFGIHFSTCTARRPFLSIRNHTELYGTIRNYTEPYGTIRNHTEPYGTIRDHTGPYGTIWMPVRPIQIHMDAHRTHTDARLAGSGPEFPNMKASCPLELPQ